MVEVKFNGDSMLFFRDMKIEQGITTETNKASIYGSVSAYLPSQLWKHLQDRSQCIMRCAMKLEEKVLTSLVLKTFFNVNKTIPSF